MSSIQRFTAGSWSEALELLYQDSWAEDIGRFRSPFVFRGVADATWPLETSLMRLGGPYPQLERHLLRNFVKYAHGQVSDRDSTWFWLTLGQHHGLPTRLLDWTHSPLAGLHFATSNLDHFDRDGAVWIVDYAKLNTQTPQLLADALEAEGCQIFTTEMLTELESPQRSQRSANLVQTEMNITSLDDFDALSEEDFLIFFEPPSLDDRVVNQFALFSVMSNVSRPVDDFLAQHPECARVVVIPSQLKPEIRDKLDLANINERVLFPGLDGLSSWLRRHYSTFPRA